MFLYMIQLHPDRDPNYFKFGYTTNIYNRLRSYKTIAPNLILRRTWPGTLQDEQRVLRLLKAKDLLAYGEIAIAPEQELRTVIEEALAS